MNGLATNQVGIQAFDGSATGAAVVSTTYNGPISLSAADSTGPITLIDKNTPAQHLMKNGHLVLSNITPMTTLGAFNLFADTTTVPGDPGGVVDVNSKANKESGSFIRINLGRQRGR